MTSRSDLEPRKGEGGGEGGEKVAKTEIATFPNKQDVLSSLLLLESTTWEKVAATFGVHLLNRLFWRGIQPVF
jgi:hypothetical protein